VCNFALILECNNSNERGQAIQIGLQLRPYGANRSFANTAPVKIHGPRHPNTHSPGAPWSVCIPPNRPHQSSTSYYDSAVHVLSSIVRRPPRSLRFCAIDDDKLFTNRLISLYLCAGRVFNTVKVVGAPPPICLFYFVYRRRWRGQRFRPRRWRSSVTRGWEAVRDGPGRVGGGAAWTSIRQNGI
jgi:hypothetical protein